MATEVHEPDHPRGSIWSAIFWWSISGFVVLFLIAVLVLALALIVGSIEHNRAVAAVEAEVTRIRAAGEPMSADELLALRRLPTEVHDSTEAWLAALGSFDEVQFKKDGEALPYVGNGKIAALRPRAEETQVGEAEAFLKKYEATLLLAFAAAKSPGECRFPLALETSADGFVSDRDKILCVDRLVRLNAHVSAVREDSEHATESLLALFALGSALDHPSTLPEYALQQHLFSLSLQETSYLLSETQFNEDQLLRLQSRLESVGGWTGLERALVGQRAVTFASLQSQPAMKAAASEEFLGVMSQLIDASQEPLPLALASADFVRDDLADRMEAAIFVEKRQLAPAASAAKNFCKAFDFSAISAVHPDLLVVVVAAERYRLKNGTFPMQLSELVPDFLPAVPLDPYDDQPFRVYSVDGKFAVYSIGRDGEDDGGKDGQGLGKPDIVVRHIIPKDKQAAEEIP